ncbi:hypothetical protein GCM10023093_22740 [Nemorincola caseinilytica]|uniref:Peptidase M48 domain-containing protein n=1 Tax=Nemorincola caseinilytica TaxID=2054315 RepID=A0ABP8NK54_9BACT
MEKALFQFMAIVAIFLMVWFGLSKVDYVRIFRLQNMSKRTEKKIGELVMRTIERTEDVIKDDSTQVILNKIRDRISSGSNAPTNIQVHLVRKGDVNAFALPGNHLIIYTGLITRCDSAEELCGVMAHEIGHITLDHVIKRLGSELGISVLASMASGGNTATVAQVIKTLSSSAFERGQESEADAFAVNCLQKARVSPEGFAVFMNKMAKMQEDIPKQMEWISSHPDSRNRVVAIRDLIKENGSYTPVLTEEEWQILRRAAAANAPLEEESFEEEDSESDTTTAVHK